MDSLISPKLGRFRKFTQKLIPRSAKEKKNPCSICDLSDRHFCQPLFRKNFVQFGCTRSVKWLERKEYFYGAKKQPKFRAKIIRNNESADRKQIGNKKNGQGEKYVTAPGDEINYVVTSRQADGVKKTSLAQTKKYEPTDSTNDVNHGQIGGTRLSSYYAYVSPRGFEKRHSRWIVRKRLRELFVPVSIESRQNLRMCQPEEDKLENGGDLNAEEIMPDLHGSSDELQKRRTENVQEEGSNVALELLKIAVNTQDILNSLSHHFKQAFVTDGSRLSLKKANDSKISVDSFMIPNMPGPVLWEHGEGANERNFGAPLYVDRLDASKDESGHQLPANLERTNFNDGFTSILYKDSEFNLTQDSNTDEEVKTGTDTRRVMENGNSHQRPRNPGRHPGIRNQKSLCIFSSTDAPTLQASPVLDLINLSTPGHSSDNLAHDQARKDAVSQTTLSSQHLDRELSLLHKAFLDQLAYFSKQLADSCRVFGHSWQTTFLADLAEQFKAACDLVTVIMGSSKRTEPASELNQLENISSNISVRLAKLRTLPHSFICNSGHHDISTLTPVIDSSIVTNTNVENFRFLSLQTCLF